MTHDTPEVADTATFFLMQGVSRDIKSRVAGVLNMRLYEKNEMIIKQDDEGDEMFFIESGSVRFEHKEGKK